MQDFNPRFREPRPVIWRTQLRRIHQADHVAHQLIEKRQLNPDVIEKRHGQHAVMGMLASGDELVFERPSVAGVKPVEKFGFEIGNIDFDRAHRGARLTRQTAIHGLKHFQGEIALSAVGRREAADRIVFDIQLIIRPR